MAGFYEKNALSNLSADGLARSKEEKQSESANIEWQGLLKAAAAKAQHESKQCESLAQSISGEVAALPVAQRERVVRVRCQALGRPHYQRAAQHKNDSDNGYAGGGEEITQRRVRSSSPGAE